MRRLTPRTLALAGLAALAALTGAAHAQEKPAGNDCQNVEGLAGSLPYRTATLALKGNAQTYGAAATVDEQVLGRLSKPIDENAREGRIATTFRITQMYGVLDVPTEEQSSGCPRELKYSLRPLDMATTSFGLGYQHPSGFGLFYGASVSYSWLAADNAALRGMLSWSASVYSGFAAALAPLLIDTGGQQGLVTFNTDYIVGGSYNFGLVTAALGYVGTQGLYARLGGADVGAFLSSVINGSDGIAALDLGLGPFDLGFGSPALRAQRRALIAPGVTTADEDDKVITDAGGEGGAWSTANVALLDISQYVDVEFTWMFEPEMMWSSAFAAVHTADFNLIRYDQKPTIGDTMGFVLRGGALNRPTMRYYGIDGGVLFSIIGELRGRIAGDLGVVFAVSYNDPRRLDLFPFAENHLAIDYAVEALF
ncbi:MAG: hypothetical protein H6703_04200 [Myxococcales bacterium]|nr:hypothetical protein [Myxococcales bacterium]